MIEIFQSKETLVRILMGLIIGIIGLSMLMYLVPGMGSTQEGAPDAVATIGGKDITTTDLSKQLVQLERTGQHISKEMRGLYVRDLLDRMVTQRAIEYEAGRLGLQVTDQEAAERIRQILPIAFTGGSVASLENYASEVQTRTGMSVPEFEEALHDSLLFDKVRRLVTDGVTVSPAEIADEFKKRNEKVKLEYVTIKPADLEAKVSVTDAELSSFFEKNKARYQIPEKRGFKFALLDLAKLRETVHPTEQAIEDYYKHNLDQYHVPMRYHAEHILFRTTAKTDAEVEELRKKAEDVLAKAKKPGANFEELAKQNSQDEKSKDKGGDLGWVEPGQFVAEFEKAAMGMKKGEIAGPVKSMFGFHIIKLLDRQDERTKTLEEVKPSIVSILAGQAADAKAADMTDKMAAAVRQSSRTPVEDIAKQFNLETGNVAPIAATEPVGPLGTSTEVRDFIFSSQPGLDSTPLHVDRGTAIVSVTDIQQARAATLAEVRAKVEADYRSEQSTTLAKQRADELSKKVQGGEALAAAAKSLGFEAQTSELLSQNDSLGGMTPMKRLASAFNLPVGQTAAPISQGTNWVVYRVTERQEPNPDDLTKQKAEIERTLTMSKQQVAFDAFQEGLKQRMMKDGKLRINETVLRRFLTAS